MTFATQSPAPRDAMACTGPGIRDLLDALACWLESHADHLNALNVFPVPDGDTGINMARTMRAAADAAAKADGEAPEVFLAASRGALLGAAGNSGVILSQMIRGFNEIVRGDGVSNGDSLKLALESAFQAGYKSVAQPVEGTILSVARETAAAITPGTSITEAISQALDGATHAVAATPTQLEKLRVAGVVDAGGEGLRLLLEGAHRWMLGEDLRTVAPPLVVSRALVGSQHSESEFGFCTQFIIEHASLDLDALKAQIESLSTSVIVAAADDVIRVHAHAALPGQILDLAVRSGVVSRISIENMELQSETARTRAETGRTGIIALAPSQTAARLLGSLGATHVIVPAAASPTVQELLNGVQRLGHEEILLLPNDKNSVLAAEQLRELTPRSIHIIPTENVVQCAQCLLAFNPDEAIESQEARLMAAMDAATIIELARANRSAELPQAQVSVGSIVAIHGGRIVASGASAADVVARAVSDLDVNDSELVTLYPCAELGETEAVELEAGIQSLFPSCEHENVPLDLPARLAIVALE